MKNKEIFRTGISLLWNQVDFSFKYGEHTSFDTENKLEMCLRGTMQARTTSESFKSSQLCILDAPL